MAQALEVLLVREPQREVRLDRPVRPLHLDQNLVPALSERTFRVIGAVPAAISLIGSKPGDPGRLVPECPVEPQFHPAVVGNAHDDLLRTWRVDEVQKIDNSTLPLE